MDSPLGSRYRIGAILGRGGMGIVHAGSDDAGNPVAVKVLHRDLAADPDVVARFVRERTILLGVRDSHVVGVRDLVVEGDTLAIVMDLVPGPDLRRALAGGPLAPAEAARIGAGVARGLAAVHAAGVVHRDVKPENVLLDTGAEPPAVRLGDFGISRVLTTPATRTALVGTPYYMAPELWAGERPGPAADLYALGVLLYELCCGSPPYVGDPATVMGGHLDFAPGRPDGIPDPLWDLLVRLLAKRAAARPAGAAQVAAELDAIAAGLAGWPAAPRAATPPGGERLCPGASGRSVPTVEAAPPAGARPRPRRAAAVLGTAAAALLIGGGTVAALPALFGPPQEPVAASSSDPDPGPLAEEVGAKVAELLGQETGTPVPAGPDCVAYDRPPTNSSLLTTELEDRCRADVKMVQRWLIRSGFLPPGSEDGRYGPRTHAAVGRFQLARCLDVAHYDIGVGPKTWTALQDDSTACGTPGAKPGTGAPRATP